MDIMRRRLATDMIGKRMMSYLHAHRKRFYKHADVSPVKDGYLIQIDQKTIKTPLLNFLCAPTEPIALAIAQEWHMQTTEIDSHTMPLTTICNTAIDNPTGISKVDLVKELLEFLHTDTLCAIAGEPDTLVDFQTKHWSPIRDWFAKRYNVNLKASANLFTLNQSDETINTMISNLMQLNKWQLCGLQSAIDCTKSCILPLAVIDNRLNVSQAVYLSRLETEYQIERWGKFEGSHDIEKYNMQAQLAAATLFYQLCSDVKG